MPLFACVALASPSPICTHALPPRPSPWRRRRPRLPHWGTTVDPIRIAASFDITVEFTATYPEAAPIIHMNNIAGYLEVHHVGQRAGAAKIAELVRGPPRACVRAGPLVLPPFPPADAVQPTGRETAQPDPPPGTAALGWFGPACVRRAQVEENLGDPLVFTVHAAMSEWLEDYLTELQSQAENAEAIARSKAEDERLVRRTNRDPAIRSLLLCWPAFPWSSPCHPMTPAPTARACRPS